MASCCRIAARFRGTGQVTGLRVFASLCVRHGWTFWGSAVLFVVVLTAEARAGAPAPLTLKAYRDTITVDDVDVALRVGGLKQRIAALGRGFDDASRLILTQHGTVLAEDAVVDDAVTAAPTHVTYAVTCVRAHAGGGLSSHHVSSLGCFALCSPCSTTQSPTPSTAATVRLRARGCAMRFCAPGARTSHTALGVCFAASGVIVICVGVHTVQVGSGGHDRGAVFQDARQDVACAGCRYSRLHDV